MSRFVLARFPIVILNLWSATVAHCSNRPQLTNSLQPPKSYCDIDDVDYDDFLHDDHDDCRDDGVADAHRPRQRLLLAFQFYLVLVQAVQRLLQSFHDDYDWKTIVAGLV